MNERMTQAASLLKEFKGDDYIFGLDCFGRLGELTASLGRRVSVVTSGVGKPWGTPLQDATKEALAAAHLELAGDLIAGPRPNSPIVDVYRLAESIKEQDPEVVVSVGGGSNIDAVKAAISICVLGEYCSSLHDLFGMGKVAALLEEHGKTLIPLVACQIASGSAAHLTKYSNVTDMESGQKLLIIDPAVTPPKALFDYKMTCSASRDLTMDGGLDGIAHCMEVFFGIPEADFERVKPVSLLGIELIVKNIQAACDDPENLTAREALGLGTDLGGYAIMIGGTNGGHLTSFSLVDVLPHGRACALMDPYYTVFFAPAIPERLRAVGAIYKAAGYTDANLESLSGRDLGVAVAEAMLALSREIGFPTTLGEVQGFTDAHIARALTAAKNPSLESKLKNMPVPLSAETVDDYMGPVLEAAKTGDFGLIRNM